MRMFSKNIAKLLFSLVLISSTTKAAVNNPAGEDFCKTCCTEAATILGDAIDVDACRLQGCERVNQGLGASSSSCERIFGNGVLRESCEIGRDFRFSGVTAKIEDDTLHACKQGNLEEIQIENPLQQDANVVNAAVCGQCCNDLNARFDIGSGGQPDDFSVDRCASVCNEEPPRTCFEQSSHRLRLACLMAIDFRTTANVSIDFNVKVGQDRNFICNANGTVTRFDLVIEEEEPEEPEEAEDGLDQVLIFSIVGGIVGINVMFCFVGFLFMRRRSRSKSKKLIMGAPSDTETIQMKIQLPGKKSSVDRWDVGSTESGSRPYNQDSLIRHVTGAVNSYLQGVGSDDGRQESVRSTRPPPGLSEPVHKKFSAAEVVSNPSPRPVIYRLDSGSESIEF